MELAVFTTGGTIDKVYFDKKSDYEVGDAIVGPLLTSMGVGFDFTVEELMKIDSLDMTPEQRAYIVMNGRVFTPDNVVKNRQENRFQVLAT